MAVRYDQKKKDEVVAFVENHNAKNGRGGQTAAVKKFKISPITIGSWLEKAGSKSVGKKKRATAKKKGVRKAAASAAPAAPAATAGGSVSAMLKRMVSIQEEIASLQGEFAELKNQL